jgi:hypothetical protein
MKAKLNIKSDNFVENVKIVNFFISLARSGLSNHAKTGPKMSRHSLDV